MGALSRAVVVSVLATCACGLGWNVRHPSAEFNSNVATQVRAGGVRERSLSPSRPPVVDTRGRGSGSLSPSRPPVVEPSFVCSPLPSPSLLPPNILDGTDHLTLPPLYLGSSGLWADAAGMLSELPLLSDFLRLASGRRVLPTNDLSKADVIYLGVFRDRGKIAALAREHGGHAVTIFVNGENAPRIWGGAHDELNGLVNISLGQRRDLSGPGYLHTSWWMLGSGILTLKRDGTVEIAQELMQPSNATAWAARPHFAAVLARHGGFPRDDMVKLLRATGRGMVRAPGKFENNMEWPRCLPNEMNIGKPAFLRSFRFNICPENSLSGSGYHTEKVPGAHRGGAVPLYWGDSDGPDPEVWNPARTIRFNESNPAELAARIARLEDDEDYRRAWFSRPVLQPGAQAWVNDWAARLLQMLREQLARHFTGGGGSGTRGPTRRLGTRAASGGVRHV